MQFRIDAPPGHEFRSYDFNIFTDRVSYLYEHDWNLVQERALTRAFHRLEKRNYAERVRDCTERGRSLGVEHGVGRCRFGNPLMRIGEFWRGRALYLAVAVVAVVVVVFGVDCRPHPCR